MAFKRSDLDIFIDWFVVWDNDEGVSFASAIFKDSFNSALLTFDKNSNSLVIDKNSSRLPTAEAHSANADNAFKWLLASN
jgi:hypothetical protein